MKETQKMSQVELHRDKLKLKSKQIEDLLANTFQKQRDHEMIRYTFLNWKSYAKWNKRMKHTILRHLDINEKEEMRNSFDKWRKFTSKETKALIQEGIPELEAQ